jgi:hypothetical protein
MVLFGMQMAIPDQRNSAISNAALRDMKTRRSGEFCGLVIVNPNNARRRSSSPAAWRTASLSRSYVAADLGVRRDLAHADPEGAGLVEQGDDCVENGEVPACPGIFHMRGG